MPKEVTSKMSPPHQIVVPRPASCGEPLACSEGVHEYASSPPCCSDKSYRMSVLTVVQHLQVLQYVVATGRHACMRREQGIDASMMRIEISTCLAQDASMLPVRLCELLMFSTEHYNKGYQLPRSCVIII
eukprot:jgi/Ulvmu1/11688/UM008_0098.1